MTEPREIDPTRQGGGNAAPKAVRAPRPLSVDEALAFRDAHAWRQIPGGAHLAVRALAAEVERLRVELDARATEQEVQELLDWQDRIRAAVPGIVRCANAAGCRERTYPWAGCCMVRAAFVELGLLPAGQPADQADDDGA
jgi:hypothetical protein